jgi:hypothetical protein
MPQLLILIGAGIGLFVARKVWQLERRRVVKDLDLAREALHGEKEPVIPLEPDPLTGVYRPKARS